MVPQFPKFFIAINLYKLEFPDGETKRPHAVGMEACIGVEYVPFPEPCPLVGKVEIYLDRCIDAFRGALRYVTASTARGSFASPAVEAVTATMPGRISKSTSIQAVIRVVRRARAGSKLSPVVGMTSSSRGSGRGFGSSTM